MKVSENLTVLLLSFAVYLIISSMALLVALKLGCSQAMHIICFTLSLILCYLVSFIKTVKKVIIILTPINQDLGTKGIHFGIQSILFFAIGYKTNITILKNNFRQTITIGILGNIIFLIFQTSLFYFIHSYPGKNELYELHEITLICIKSLPYTTLYSIELLKKSSMHTKHIEQLLEVEAFTSVIISIFCYTGVWLWKLQANQPEFLIKYFFSSLLSTIIAFILGILARPTFLINDLVTMFFYTVGSLTVLFYICNNFLNCHVKYSEIVYGLVINKLQYLANEESKSHFDDYWNTIFSIVEIAVYMSAGVTVSLRGMEIFGDILKAFIMYVYTILIRTILWTLYSLITKDFFGYNLPFSVTLLCIFAQHKPCISLTYISYNPSLNIVYNYKIESLVSIYICIYSLFTFIVFPLLYKYTDFNKFSIKRKKLFEYLYDQILKGKTKSELHIKKALFSANANWKRVQQLTKIDEPKFQLNYLVKKRIENLPIECLENEKSSIILPTINIPEPCVPAEFIDSTEVKRKYSDESSKEILALPKTDDYIKTKILKKIREKNIISYNRQLNQGIISKRTHYYLISECEKPNFNEIFKVREMKICLAHLYTFLANACLMLYDDYVEAYVPLNSFRKNVFELITSKEYRIVLTVFIYLDSISQILVIYFYNIGNKEMANLLQMVDYFCYGFFIGVFVLHIIGLGFLKYFEQRIWTIEFFVAIIIRTVMHFSLYIQIYYGQMPEDDIMHASKTTIYLKYFFLLRFYIINQFTDNKFIEWAVDLFNKYKSKNLIKVYEKKYGKSIGYDDLLPTYHNIFGMSMTSKQIARVWIDKRKINKCNMMILNEFSKGLTSAMKSKHVAFKVLNDAEHFMKELQRHGFVHEYEKWIFGNCLNKIRHELRHLSTVEHPKPIALFNNIFWLKGDYTCRNFLLKSAKIRVFNPQESILDSNKDNHNLHLITSGVCKYIYKGDSLSLYKVLLKGILPNSDYYLHLKFHEVQRDFLSPGNLIGEFGLITGRPYNMRVICKTTVTTISIPFAALFKLFYKCHFGRVRITKLWKTIGLRFCIKHFPLYFKTLSRESLIIRLHDSLVPILEEATLITISKDISDVILIEGYITDAFTRCELLAPLHITATNQTFILNQHLKIYEVPPRLMLIPKEGVNRIKLLKSYDLIKNYLTMQKVTPKFVGLDSCIKITRKQKIIKNFIKTHGDYLITDFILQENDPKIIIPCCFQKKLGKKKNANEKKYIRARKRKKKSKVKRRRTTSEKT